MMNILNGGAHADNSVDIQEFMIAPIGAATFTEAVQWGAETYHALKSVLKQQGLSTGLGLEGGRAPDLGNNRAALDLIIEAVSKAGYPPGPDVAFAIDAAAPEFYSDGAYQFEGAARYAEKMTASTPSARTLPAGLAGGPALRRGLGRVAALTARWALGCRWSVTTCSSPTPNGSGGASTSAVNALLVKVNQIGSLTETLDAVSLAHRGRSPA